MAADLTALGMGGVAFRECDEERLARLRAQMSAAGLEALILRLPENILYTTGFWPLNGLSAAIVPVEGEATIFVPRGEDPFAADAWTRDVRPFAPGSLEQMVASEDVLAALIADVGRERGLARAALGYEGSFDLVAASHWEGEVHLPSGPALAALRRTLPDADFIDGTAVLRRSRTVKSKQELMALRVATEAAAQGLAAARGEIHPRATEMEVAEAVEWAIYRTSGTTIHGHRIERARGFASVMSGPNSAKACLHFNVSTPRRLQPGDLVTIELGAYADGYWTDLTRVFTVGEPTSRQREIHAIVREAQLAAISIARPGVTCGQLDRAAREVITKAGYNYAYPHVLGHATGLQYHEPPVLHPTNDHVIEPGEVYTIEPGIYLENWGGIRLEDLIAISGDGEQAEVFSDTVPRELAVP